MHITSKEQTTTLQSLEGSSHFIMNTWNSSLSTYYLLSSEWYKPKSTRTDKRAWMLSFDILSNPFTVW